MRKISIALVISLLLLMFLSACGTTGTQDKAEKPADASETEAVATEDVKESDTTADTSYEVETVGEKDTNENGEVIGDCHYQKVVFTNSNKAFSEINEEIKDAGDDFFDEGFGKQYEEYFSVLPDAAKAELVEYPYSATYDVNSVYIDDKYVSITFDWDWYAGGVHNFGNSALNFDAATGEELDFDDMFASEAEARSILIEKVNAMIDENPANFFEDAKETIKNYDLDDLSFSIDKDNITVYFAPYDLAPGASGPSSITIAR